MVSQSQGLYIFLFDLFLKTFPKKKGGNYVFILATVLQKIITDGKFNIVGRNHDSSVI